MKAGGMILRGDRECIAQFARLPKLMVSGKVSRIALNAGCGILKRGAIAVASAHGVKGDYSGTGLLAKNIIVKHLPKRHSDKRAAIVGVRSKRFAVRKTQRGTWRGVGMKQVSKWRDKGAEIRYVNPGNYAHLVEFGTGPRRPKKKQALWTPWGLRKSTKGSRARPFMRPAFDTLGDIAANRMAVAANQAIARELKSLVGLLTNVGVHV